jgi:hypothetical protein
VSGNLGILRSMNRNEGRYKKNHSVPFYKEEGEGINH